MVPAKFLVPDSLAFSDLFEKNSPTFSRKIIHFFDTSIFWKIYHIIENEPNKMFYLKKNLDHPEEFEF